MVEKVQSLPNHFHKNSYPLQILTKKCFGRKFLSLQNHFLENSYSLKILIDDFFGRKFFIVAKSYPRE